MHATPTTGHGPQLSATQPAAGGRGRLVTDAPTRVFHGLLALSFLGAYLTADGERWRLLHVTLGYTMAGLLLFRVLYGIWGPKPSQLGVLWRKVSNAPAWAKATAQVRSWEGAAAQWRQGQNLLMGVAVLLLLATIVPLTLTGYATYNDWGGEWFEEVHGSIGEVFLWVVLAHLGLVVAISWWRRKNHAALMWSGRLPGNGPDLVRHNRVWLASLLLAAVCGYLAWEWYASPQGLVPWRALGSPAVWISGDGDDDDD